MNIYLKYLKQGSTLGFDIPYQSGDKAKKIVRNLAWNIFVEAVESEHKQIILVKSFADRNSQKEIFFLYKVI